MHILEHLFTSREYDYTNNDMTEFRKYMQKTVILAKQISQIVD